jgi:hypothetical protein
LRLEQLCQNLLQHSAVGCLLGVSFRSHFVVLILVSTPVVVRVAQDVSVAMRPVTASSGVDMGLATDRRLELGVGQYLLGNRRYR